MKDTFVIAKTLKLPWIDRFFYLPGGIICCILYPVISVVSGRDHLLGWPLSTWLLIGIGLLILAVIERLALIFGELQAVTFLARNLFKEADAECLEVSQRALRRMQHSVRRALGVSEDEIT
jgi:NhaP-type Na+/H+ or K+/H+ antiporter